MNKYTLINEILGDINLSFLDYKFIDTMIYFESDKTKREILNQYKEIYQDEFNNTLVTHQKESNGKHKANIWLRELIASKRLT
ncbi:MULTISPECIES: hypothetical protein [unclassified Francisella]|uniref:hypothetical protein n=1 Tax=unclassified Francisella TaxID=2610885 RepID=UPI002E336E83|nr:MULTISPECIES: hypothetical protein [unclassified Francisella]MED7820141.1 hypothetical protein [Francisella sp. 19S2-4]MED7830961.1 hypothetical protein [Francisella sp. 19S2-10]